MSNIAEWVVKEMGVTPRHKRWVVFGYDEKHIVKYYSGYSMKYFESAEDVLRISKESLEI